MWACGLYPLMECEGGELRALMGCGGLVTARGIALPIRAAWTNGQSIER